MRYLSILGLVVSIFIPGAAAAPPGTINIQGVLEAPGGGPVTGTHDYQIGFHDADTGGTEIGVVTGNVTFSDTGRFSINVTPPAGILTAPETWYELAIDTGDDGLDADDTFPDRVKVHSVPFALLAADAILLGGSPASSFAPAGQGGAFQTSGNVTSNSPGDLADDDFVFGSDQLDDDGNSDHGRRFFFDKSKGAFRAGRALGTQWDDANVGTTSTALGYSTTASGFSSTAMGYATTASGDSSTAMGNFTTASNNNSTAMGSFTTASGKYSTAMGRSSMASGRYSTAMGQETDASGDASTAMGQGTIASGTFSTAIGQGIEAGGANTVAIGLNNQDGTVVSQDNTMAIMGGNVGIGTITPINRLHVENDSPGRGAVLYVANTGGNDNSTGILVRAGLNDGTGRTVYLRAQDGVGASVGVLENRDGNLGVVDATPKDSKTNIRDTEVDALAIIEGLRVVDFNQKSAPDGPTIHGFIAEEAQEVFPEMVSELDKDVLGISKGTLIPILTKAIQDQEEKIAGLSREVDRLRNLVETK